MSDVVFVTNPEDSTVIETEASPEVLLTSSEGVVSSIITEGREVVVVTTQESEVAVIESISIGPQGIQGIQGVQGIPGPVGGTALVYPAGVTLSGHRMVVLNSEGKVIYADCTIPSHANKVFGMTTGAAVADADATIQTGGVLEEPSWNWTIDVPVWLGETGLLQQSPPSAGFSLIIGFPISATFLFIDIREPIFLI